jgi:hypothetical protein
MSELTRRGFVTRSASTAVGMTAIGAMLTDQAQAAAKVKAGHETESHEPAGSQPVVAFVRDPRSGEVSLMSGEREVRVHDRKLAAQISRAAR